MKNLWIEHWSDMDNKNGKHGSTKNTGVDIRAAIDGKSVIVASLYVEYRSGYPRVTLNTTHSDVKVGT